MKKLRTKIEDEINNNLKKISNILKINFNIDLKTPKVNDEILTELIIISGYLKLMQKKTDIGICLSETEIKKLEKIYLRINKIIEMNDDSDK